MIGDRSQREVGKLLPNLHEAAQPYGTRAMKPLLSLVACAVLFLFQGEAVSQTTSTNARALKSYMVPAQISRLEWELIQFNVLWTGSFSSNQGSYFTSYPVAFDYKTFRFRTVVGVSERRDYQDPDPWSSLSKLRRESQLRDVVEQLTGLLQQSFPELKARPEFLFIEFKYRPDGAAFVTVARYENGVLSLAE